MPKNYKVLHKLKKHSENRKTLPWELHIGCQICKIALFKSNEKVKNICKKNSGDTSDSSDSCEKNHATSPQKNHATFFSFFSQFFGKWKLTRLTTNVMFSVQRFVIFTMFCCWELVRWRLHDFFLQRGCRISWPTHLGIHTIKKS